MPVFLLNDDIIFPPIHKAWKGLLAVGGDLSPERLIEAYRNGIFPWYGPGEPIMWWSPNPRCVLFPHEFKLQKSLKRTLQSKKFEVRFDENFEKVIEHCSKVERSDQEGTWISDEMKQAYILLHKAGFAHSVETYLDNNLVGGLYGVSIGKAFFGESMFHMVSDASKVALFHLCQHLIEREFLIIDAQQTTSHLISLGAKEIKRMEFKRILIQAIPDDTIVSCF